MAALLDILRMIVTSGYENDSDAPRINFLGEDEAAHATRQDNVDHCEIDIPCRENLPHFDGV
jgi:hypothetical protein